MAKRRAIGYQTSGSTAFPAPVGGLNDRDPLAAMPVEDAVILENWWPEPSRLTVRDGYRDFATGFTGPVETLVEYAPPSGLNEVFAASNGNIYNLSAGGAFNIPLEVRRLDWQGDQLLYTTARTNLFLWSADFSQSYWAKTRSSIAVSGEVGPDGGTTYKLTENTTANNTHTLSRVITPLGSTTYTLTFIAKAAERRYVRVTVGNLAFIANPNDVNVDLLTGQVSATDLSRATVTMLANGWVRITATVTTTPTPGNIIPQLMLATGLTGTNTTYTGDGVSGVHVAMAQFEVGAVPTSYIATQASIVTVTDYTYTPPLAITTGVAPISGAALSVRNTNGGLTTFGVGNGVQTSFSLPSLAVVGKPDVTGQTNNRWQSASVTTPGGNFLYLFNGADKPQLYNGTTWQAVDAGSSPIAITGVTTSLLVQGCVFKNRLFMVERGSMRAWYLPVSSVGGAATALDLGAIFQRGGSLVGMFTWTIDAGSGADDHAVFISSEGEVVVYSGTDPSTAANWNMIGLFYLGKPIGRRCAVKFGGDLLIICETGVMPLGRSLLSSAIDRRASIVDKIQNSINAAVSRYRNNFGWELCIHPEQNAIILNIPAGPNYQFVQNTLSSAWTKFTGWSANTFADTQAGLLYGDSNSVKQAWSGKVDGTDMIVADVLQSFQSFGSPANNKYFTMVRPFLRSDGNPSILYAVNGDYVPVDPTGVLSFSPPTGMTWGQMIWGSMTWGGEFRQLGGWNTVGGVFYAAALRMKVQSNASDVEWASTSFVYQQGGLL